jgi:hypothetical protein
MSLGGSILDGSGETESIECFRFDFVTKSNCSVTIGRY